MEILLYVTDSPTRVITGNPLVLYMPDDDSRQEFLNVIVETLEASVLHMKNGDHIVVRKVATK